MEYLKPIEQLKARIKFDQGVIFSLLVLIGLLLIVVPQILKGTPYLLEDRESLPMVIKSEPWKLSMGRVEGFVREYLEARFHWSPETILSAKDRLVRVTTEGVYGRLKDSVSANESLSQNQKARSYYVIERAAYSNSLDQAELQVTRVLRVRTVALATPLSIRLLMKEAPLSAQNPYGLVLDGIEEQEASRASPSSGEEKQ